MDDLTHFARQLADRLAAGPGGPRRSASVAEIREQLLPYRLQRRALGLESVEDYETVLLRLIAEQGGHVRTAPDTAAQRCREELAQPNPDLRLLDELGEVTVMLGSFPSAAPPPQGDNREDRPMSANQPKEEIPHYETAELSLTGPPPAVLQHPQLCPHCAKAVPVGRPVTFCPWCGDRLKPLVCSRCGTELEAAWLHCITCGAPQ